jgi:hypothetical protein
LVFGVLEVEEERELNIQEYLPLAMTFEEQI